MTGALEVFHIEAEIGALGDRYAVVNFGGWSESGTVRLNLA